MQNGQNVTEIEYIFTEPGELARWKSAKAKLKLIIYTHESAL